MKMKVEMEGGNLPSVIKHLSVSKESLTLHNIVVNNNETISTIHISHHHDNNEEEDDTKPLKLKLQDGVLEIEGVDFGQDGEESERQGKTTDEEEEEEEEEEDQESFKTSSPSSTDVLRSEGNVKEKRKEKEKEKEKGKEKEKEKERKEKEKEKEKEKVNEAKEAKEEQKQAQVDEEAKQASQDDDQVRCMICLEDYPKKECVTLTCQEHMLCEICLEGYLTSQIMGEGRVEILCPEPKCKKVLDDELLKKVLPSPVYSKYQNFALKKFLRTQKDCHFCPAPNCDYAVIIKRKELFGVKVGNCEGDKSKIVCQSPTCKTEFCFYCGEKWHPSLSCEQNKTLLSVSGGELINQEHTKPCPKCNVPIFKLQDGTCNHMECTSCGTHFCWLCMKEINDMHYFSPTGCTFYADEKMSTTKRTVLQLTMVVGAPVFISLIGAISVPAVMIAVPVQTYKKINKKYTSGSRKRRIALGLGMPASILLSPVIAAFVVGVGIPILFVGAYVVIPGYLIHETRKNRKNMKDRTVALIENVEASTSTSTPS